MRTLLIYVKLYLREVYDMELYGACVSRNYLCKIDDLLLCPFRGIGRRMEINRLYHNSALCYHVACHGAVYASRKEKHRLSVGTYGHSACSLYDLGVDVYLLSHLDMYHDFGITHIHLCLGERRKYIISHIGVYLIRGNRIVLVRPLCPYLEGKMLVRILLIYEFYYLFSQLLISFVRKLSHGAYAHYSEYLL